MAKVTMEAPGGYVMYNDHGSARRRFPKLKGKAAKKQMKRLRIEIRENKKRIDSIKASSNQVKTPDLMSPSKDETRESER